MDYATMTSAVAATLKQPPSHTSPASWLAARPSSDRSMKTLELNKWHPGLKTVSLIKAVRTYALRSLSETKTDVERFLDGEVIVLEFATEQSREAFREKAEELGVIVRESLQQ